MDFKITGNVEETSFPWKIITLHLYRDNIISHCAAPYHAEFKDNEEAWAYLAPMLRSLINNSYPMRKREVITDDKP